MKKRVFAALLAAFMLLLSGCGAEDTNADTPADDAPAAGQEDSAKPEEAPDASVPAEAGYEDGFVTRVASLSGPTSMGLSLLMISENAHYDFQVYTAANEIVPLLAKGEVDAALIPANLAANVSKQTDGAVKVLNINTLGGLEVLAPAALTVESISALQDRTVYLAATGKGATPEYAARSLIQAAGVENVNLDFSNPEPANVVAALAANPEAIAILPQPFATVAAQQNEGLEIKLSLSDEWAKLMGGGSQLVTGVTVVRADYLASHPAAAAQFALDQAASVASVNADPEAAGAAIETLGIVKAPIAQKAIPRCNLVCITGDKMQQALEAYLQTLYDFDPAVIGGEMPSEDFYQK